MVYGGEADGTVWASLGLAVVLLPCSYPESAEVNGYVFVERTLFLDRANHPSVGV
jgi:hypothetical protein